jgi:NADH:ubiquinone oxidoreductase subunit 4 (subunit M)
MDWGIWSKYLWIIVFHHDPLSTNDLNTLRGIVLQMPMRSLKVVPDQMVGIIAWPAYEHFVGDFLHLLAAEIAEMIGAFIMANQVFDIVFQF